MNEEGISHQFPHYRTVVSRILGGSDHFFDTLKYRDFQSSGRQALAKKIIQKIRPATHQDNISESDLKVYVDIFIRNI